MTRAERACQIWAVLVWAAKNRQMLTYVFLSKLIGVPRMELGGFLELIQSYCLLKELPPLTILVVQQASGLVDIDFSGANADEHAKVYMEVYEYDWLGYGTPQPEDLEEAEAPER